MLTAQVPVRQNLAKTLVARVARQYLVGTSRGGPRSSGLQRPGGINEQR